MGRSLCLPINRQIGLFLKYVFYDEKATDQKDYERNAQIIKILLYKITYCGPKLPDKSGNNKKAGAPADDGRGKERPEVELEDAGSNREDFVRDGGYSRYEDTEKPVLVILKLDHVHDLLAIIKLDYGPADHFIAIKSYSIPQDTAQD